MKVLLIGGINPNSPFYQTEEYSDDELSNQAANSRWMWSLINGFEKNGSSVKVINVPNIPSFQESKKHFFHKSYFWTHDGKTDDYCIGFLNLFPFSLFSRKRALVKACKKFLKDNPDTVIIGITPHLPIVDTLSKLSRKYTSCLIVPDLPDYTGRIRMHNPIYRLLKKFDVTHFYKKVRTIKKLIVLTDQMESALHSGEALRIECIADEALANMNNVVPQQFTITYTGTVHDNYGVYEVAQAIHNSDLDVTFIICGDGTGLKRIRKDFGSDQRIRILGSVSPEESIRIQRASTILINPRPDSGEDYLKYSFPSKTLEYMLAGKPVVCHKLPGIPEEYDGYLDYLSSNGESEILAKIHYYLTLGHDQIKEIGEKARDFALREKNSVIQTKKIERFLEGN